MNTLVILTTVAASLIHPASSNPINRPTDNILEPGICPEITGLSFNLREYSGHWHEAALYANVTAPLVGSGYRPDLACVTASYNYTAATSLLDVTNKGLDEHRNIVTIKELIYK